MRDLYFAELFHPLLTLFLLLEQFAFPGNVPPVAFRRHILAEGGNGFTGYDAGTDGSLDRDFELMLRDFFFKAFNE